MTAIPVTRLYVVAATDTGIERIIRAESKAKAVTLASVARIATQGDLERLLSIGVMVESPEAQEPVDEAVHEETRPRRGRPKGSKARPTTLHRSRNV